MNSVFTGFDSFLVGVVRLLTVALLLASGALSAQALAVGDGIAVLYPEVGEPYRAIYEQIVDGIEQKAGNRISIVQVAANATASGLNERLRREGARVVIALGRQGAKSAGMVSGEFDVVVGGVLAPPNDVQRNMLLNTLTPDPALLFSRLKKMFPAIRRVYTVANPGQNAWLLSLAKEKARAQGLELVIREASDLRGSLAAFNEILATADNRRDAIWLPVDATTVEEGTVLPHVLHDAWERNLVVFSSSIDHVRRGALFGLYPDNIGMGRSLGEIAVELLPTSRGKASGVVPLREMQSVVNLRTARHFGLGEGRVQEFDMVFRE